MTDINTAAVALWQNFFFVLKDMSKSMIYQDSVKCIWCNFQVVNFQAAVNLKSAATKIVHLVFSVTQMSQKLDFNIKSTWMLR